MKEVLDRLAARHGFPDCSHVAGVAIHPTDPTGALVREIRHFSRQPTIATHEVGDAFLDGEPTQKLLDTVGGMARHKRSLIAREAAMTDAGHSRLETPYWSLRAHRLAAQLTRGAGFRYEGLLALNPSEIDPTEPIIRKDGWQAQGGTLQGDGTYELRVEGFMDGDMLVYDCITINGLPRNETTALLLCTSQDTRLSVRSDMPETMVATLVGRDIADVVSHPAWGAHAGVRITAAEMDHGGDVPWLDLTVEPVFEWLAEVPEGVDATWRS